MKRFLQILLLLNILAFAYGLYLQYILHNKMYLKVMGFSVLFMVFVLLPLFLYHRYKDKTIEDFRFKGFNNKDDAPDN